MKLENVIPLRKFCTVTTTQQPVAEQQELDKLCKVVELELRGNDPAVLRSFMKFATMVGSCFNIDTKT